MTIALVSRELLFASRIMDAATRARVQLVRVDEPADLPPPESVSLALVDWGERALDWGRQLSEWRAAAPDSKQPRLVLFGPHTDREAHEAARAAGVGPMWARSKLLATLDELLDAPRAPR